MVGHGEGAERWRRYAAWFHYRALYATAEPFLRKAEDPLRGDDVTMACADEATTE